jgi:hypothetical protein
VPANARPLVRRLRQRNPDARIVFGLVQKSALAFQERLSRMGADEYASSLEDMLEIARAVTEHPAAASPATPPQPAVGNVAFTTRDQPVPRTPHTVR